MPLDRASTRVRGSSSSIHTHGCVAPLHNRTRQRKARSTPAGAFPANCDNTTMLRLLHSTKTTPLSRMDEAVQKLLVRHLRAVLLTCLKSRWKSPIATKSAASAVTARILPHQVLCQLGHCSQYAFKNFVDFFERMRGLHLIPRLQTASSRLMSE